MVKRLAPVQAPPKVTVRQKDGSPTWSHDNEIAARRETLVTIVGAEPLSLQAEPRFFKPRNGYFLRRLLHSKLEMCSGQLHSCQMERLVREFGAEALQIKTSLEKRLLKAQARHSRGLWALRSIGFEHQNQVVADAGSEHFAACCRSSCVASERRENAGKVAKPWTTTHCKIEDILFVCLESACKTSGRGLGCPQQYQRCKFGGYSGQTNGCEKKRTQRRSGQVQAKP